MVRAAVLISVGKTGNLPQLQETAIGLAVMQKWAKRQEFAIVTPASDAADSVTVADIKKAIKDIVDRANVDQLVLYFSGHGVNIGSSDVVVS